MSDWFRYDWELHGITAQFLVDLAYQDQFDTMGDFVTLLYVNCKPARGRDGVFSWSDRRRLDALLKKCIRLLGKSAVYVGSIDMGSQRRYYFYTSDARLLVPLYELCSSETRMDLTCAKAVEPNRQTYYRLLCPDAAKRQGVANAQYIHAMGKRGDDASANRRVNLHLYFPSAQTLSAFVQEAMQAGFATGESRYCGERELPHYVVMHVVSPLTWKSVTGLTTRCIAIAQAHGGMMERADAVFVGKRRG